MHNTSLVVFANFRIDNKERYLRLKDSFFSFKGISAEKWVINIRGSYKEQTKNFLQEHLQNKFYHYDMESNNGWFHDTRIMLKDIDSDFVFFKYTNILLFSCNNVEAITPIDAYIMILGTTLYSEPIKL